jgi:CRP/FNR family cyclic AMP-dependent transcriptional regulator
LVPCFIVQDSQARFTRSVRAGEVIFREGDAGNTMFVLRAGRVRITRQVRGGEKTYATLGPGEFFGEMAILNGKPRSATARAVEEVTLVELDAGRFEAMITSQAEIAVRIIQKLARRLEDADALIAILTKRDPKTRVILGLAREAELRGFPGAEEDSMIVQRDLTEFSEELGVKRAEVDEVVGRLIRVGLVKPVEDGLEVASLARLNEFLSFLEERGIVSE